MKIVSFCLFESFNCFLTQLSLQKNMTGMYRTHSRWGQPNTALTVHDLFTIPRPHIW